MTKLGLSVPEILTLRRAEMTLRRWYELECGTGDNRTTRMIERDEVSGKPFMRVQYQSGTGWKDIRHQVADGRPERCAASRRFLSRTRGFCITSRATRVVALCISCALELT